MVRRVTPAAGNRQGRGHVSHERVGRRAGEGVSGRVRVVLRAQQPAPVCSDNTNYVKIKTYHHHASRSPYGSANLCRNNSLLPTAARTRASSASKLQVRVGGLSGLPCEGADGCSAISGVVLLLVFVCDCIRWYIQAVCA